jgi:hypothetical protein
VRLHRPYALPVISIAQLVSELAGATTFAGHVSVTAEPTER